MKYKKLLVAMSVVSVTAGSAQAEFLSDLVPLKANVGFGQLRLDENVCGTGPIRVRGKLFQKGVTAHANSNVSYDLGGAYQVFSAVIGIDDSANDLACGGGPSPYVISARFVVELDGQQVFTQDLDDSSDRILVCLNVSGVQTLTLRTTAFGSAGIDRRHTVWADAQVLGTTDCNANGIPDACDIAGERSLDENGDGVPDECEDSDGDGVPDDVDICPNSNLSDTIVIAGCDTEVANELFDDGCTIADRIAQCADAAVNNAVFVCCIAHLTNDWKDDGVISGADKGPIQSCAAQADVP